ncbi:hypothetical protein TRFO_03764 [Tritrichomonas foetus]|uniref:Uncharacterized protein n=1 Tax=Tritrichomonas foetus TaxID=1144522 RepID=A0A1J4KRN6_9EUKA|nr:hypothetical protein TRFO_03764 [Tritrichomonas foetus]|eukprot:OHT12125.1 hypothetical protein TRFO_03764 [Tritrichomonas foetus]
MLIGVNIILYFGKSIFIIKTPSISMIFLSFLLPDENKTFSWLIWSNSYKIRSFYFTIFIIKMSEEELHFKIVVVGDNGVGKTSLIHRMVDNEFDEEGYSTLALPGWSQKELFDPVSNKKYFVDFWDTSGSKFFRPGNNFIANDANAIVYVASYDNIESLRSIPSLANEKVNGNHDQGEIVTVFVVNKSDLINSKSESHQKQNDSTTQEKDTKQENPDSQKETNEAEKETNESGKETNEAEKETKEKDSKQENNEKLELITEDDIHDIEGKIREENVQFYRVSAKTGEGIEDIVVRIGTALCTKFPIVEKEKDEVKQFLDECIIQ